MSNPIVKEKSGIPTAPDLKGYANVDYSKLGLPMRKYKFKVGYGGLIQRRINPIDKDSLSNDDLINAIEIVRYSRDFKEVCRKSDKINNLDLRYQVCRSYSALEFWQKSPGKKIDDFRTIIINNLRFGSSYSRDIKDIFAYGFRKFYSNPKEGYEKWGRKHIVDNYNYTPPLQYLILFKEEFDDMGECFNIPTKKISKEIEEEIEEILDSILPDQLEYVRPESLFEIKISGSSDVSLMPSKHYVESSKSGINYTYKFRARRERIQISPQNNRDIGICDISTYYTVRMLDEYFMQILKGLESSALGSSDIYEKIRKHHNLKNRGTSFYYMRDYKKSALTMSHSLVEIIRRCLLKKYGENHDFKYLSMYLNQEIRDGDKIIRPKRGFPLGMGNHLYTLVNIICGQMLRTRTEDCLSLTLLAGNDDSSLHVEIKDNEMGVAEAAYSIISTDIELHSEIDMVLQEKKLFWGWDSVFFEEYSHPNFANKEGLFYAGIGALRLCETIAEAKEHSSNILSFCKFDVKELLELVTSWFGWEFFPGEIRLDYSLGGWHHSKYKNGLDIIMSIEEDHLYDLSRAIIACKNYRVLQKDEKFQTSSGKVSERFGIKPLRTSYDEDDLLRNFLFPDSLLINRGEKLEKHVKDLSIKYRKIQEKRSKTRGHCMRHDLFVYYFQAYDRHDIPECCVEKIATPFPWLVPDQLLNSFKVSDPLGQFLTLREKMGDIKLSDDFKEINYISKYNLKYIESHLKSKGLNLEKTDIKHTHIQVDRFGKEVARYIYQDKGNIIYTPIGESAYDIPYGLDYLANNPINRFVNKHYNFPIKYNALYRKMICTPRCYNSKLITPEEIDEANSLIKEFPDIDVTKVLMCSTSYESAWLTCRGLSRVKDVLAASTKDEIERTKLKLCDKHENGHAINWLNEDTYPQPDTDSLCYLCNMMDSCMNKVDKFSPNWMQDQEREEGLLATVYKSILGSDVEPHPTWFKPKGGWGLYSEPIQETEIVQEEEELDQPELDEEIVEEVDEEIEIMDEEVYDQDQLEEDESDW